MYVITSYSIHYTKLYEMTVEETLIEPLIEHGLAKKEEAKLKAEQLIQQVGLSVDMLSRYPHEFSGGQRQRIAIARARNNFV